MGVIADKTKAALDLLFKGIGEYQSNGNADRVEKAVLALATASSHVRYAWHRDLLMNSITNYFHPEKVTVKYAKGIPKLKLKATLK